MAKSSEAIAIIAQNDPNIDKSLGKGTKDLFNKAAGSVGNFGNTLENLGKKVYSTSQITYSKRYKNLSTGVGLGAVNIATGIDKTTESITGTLDKFTEQIRLNTEPFSEYVGSTLGTLTGVLQDPLGPNGLGNVANRLLNQVSPGLGEKVNGLNQSLNLQALSRFPSQVMSSVDHILTGIGNLLAVPLNILSEIYYGYQAIMQSISKMISNVMKGLTQFLFDFLDSLIPIKSVLGLLEQVSSLAGQIGSIAGAFNISAITNITNTITNFTDQFTSALNNPLDLVSSFLPPQVSGLLNDPQSFIEGLLPQQVQGFISGMQNPQNLLKSFLPADMAAGFDKIADMTGFGYHGNAGWGFRQAANGAQSTALSNIMSQFNNKMGAMAPLLAGQAETPEGYQAQLNNGRNASQYNEARRDTKPQYTSSQRR